MAKSVLIVEDEPQIREILRRQLEISGYTSRGVATGEEALEIVAQEPPDVIVLDINLPGMSGFEMLETLRKNPDTARIGVVMLTAQDGYDDVIRGYNGGCTYYVPKPYRLRELLHGLALATR